MRIAIKTEMTKDHPGNFRLISILSVALVISLISCNSKQVTILESDRVLQKHENVVWSVGFTEDDRNVFSGSSIRNCIVWDLETNTRKEYGYNNSEGVVSLSQLVGNLLVATMRDGSIISVNLSDDEQKGMKSMDYTTVLCSAVNPIDSSIWSGHLDGTLRMQNLEDLQKGEQDKSGKRKRPLYQKQEPKSILKGHQQSVASLSISDRGRIAISAGYDGAIILWDLQKGIQLQKLKGHSAAATCVALSPDDKLAVSGSIDGTVKIWDVVEGEEIGVLAEDEDIIYSIAFSEEGKYFLTGSREGRIALWESATGKRIDTYEASSFAVYSLAFSHDGNYAVSGGEDGLVRLWRINVELSL